MTDNWFNNSNSKEVDKNLQMLNTKKTPIQTEPANYPTDTTQPTPNVHQPLYQPQPQPDSPTTQIFQDLQMTDKLMFYLKNFFQIKNY